MSTLIEKTLEKIREEKIRPEARWKGTISNIVFWIISVSASILAGLMAALAVHIFVEIDWDAYQKAQFSWYDTLLSGVPLLWLLFLIFFLGGALLFFQRTKRGYRHSWVPILGCFLFVSAVGGYLIEDSPVDEPLEHFFMRSFPHSEGLSDELFPGENRQWSDPERGLLGGEITQTHEQEIQLEDLNGKTWEIEYEETSVSKDVELSSGKSIKVIGEQEDEDTFTAEEIREWKNVTVREEDEEGDEEGDDEEDVDDHEEEEKQEEQEDEEVE